MNGKIFNVCFILFSFFVVGKAQNYVIIPDANFVSYLQSIVPSAMNGNQMDTTNVAVTTTTHSVNVYNKNISNLFGIQYFSSLTYLNCQNNGSLTSLPPLATSLQTLYASGNSISSLPALPGSLTYLDCSNNSLTGLPPLPNSLNHLDCGFNSLSTLPTLPHSLTYLNCSVNALTVLPPFPPFLTYLDCGGNGNGLTILPALPNTLVTLFCNDNGFTNLPTLPNSITWLRCGSNYGLTNLPTLPTSLITLECQYNYFTSLPVFPNSIKTINCFYSYYLTSYPAWPTSLLYLDCSNGYLITSLPVFPNSLQQLDCSFNPHLKSLPTLPNSIWRLNCGYDSIYCFPVFPSSITSIAITPNNVFTCLPNYLPAMDAATLAYPLCSSGNPNACPLAGIEQITEMRERPNIYPNPCKDSFEIETNSNEEYNINLFDASGKLFLSRTIKSKANVETNELESGFYFLTIKNTHSQIITVQKVAVQH